MKAPKHANYCRECGKKLGITVNPVSYDEITGSPVKMRHTVSCPRYSGGHDLWVWDEFVGPASYLDRFLNWFSNV